MKAAALAVVIAVGAASLGAAEENALLQAKSYLAKGELKSAEIAIKNVLKDAPQDLEARILLGQLALREDDGAAAERSFAIALRQSGDRSRLLPLLGRAYLLQGKSKRILDELTPDNLEPEAAAQIDDLRARAAFADKNWSEVEQEANAALALQPEMAEALLTLAFLHRQRSDDDGAEALVDRALRKAPTNVMALDIKGQLRATKSDPRGAGEAFAAALAQHPDDVTARLGEAASGLASGDVALANQDIDKVLARQTSNPVALYLKALIEQRNGHSLEALVLLEPAAHALRDELAPQILLGELNLRAGHADKAEGYALHAVSLDPRSTSAKLLLAEIYRRRDQSRDIVALLQPVALSEPDNAAVEMMLGDALARLGRHQAAVKALDHALRRRPDDTDLRIRLDASRMETGDRSAAMKDLSALLHSKPRAASANVLLITATITQGQLGDALTIAEAAREQMPADPMPDHLRGRIHLMMGDWSAAEDDFAAALKKAPDFLDGLVALASLRQWAGHADQADRLYRDALDRDPGRQDKNARVLAAWSTSAEKLGDQEAALERLLRAVSAQPDALDYRLDLVSLLLRQQKQARALAMAQALDRDRPGQAAIITALARAQQAAGLPDQAAQSWRRVAETQSDPVLAQIELGHRLDQLGRPQDGLRAFLAATASDPASLAAWSALVVATTLANGQESGLAIIREAVRNAAVAPFEQTLRGDCSLAAQHFAEAQTFYHAALRRQPQAWLVLRLAEAKIRAGDKTGQQTILADWLRLNPDDFEVRADYAALLLSRHDEVGARREYLALLRSNPANVGVLNNLAWLYRTSDGTKALAYANFAFGLAPSSPQVADTLGWINLQQNNIARAKTLLQMAHRQMPENPEISYHFAAALAKAGEIDGALRLIKPLAERDAHFSSQDEARTLLRTLVASQ